MLNGLSEMDDFPDIPDYTQLDVFALIHQDVLDEPIVFAYDRKDGVREPITRREYVKMLQQIKKDIERQLDMYEALWTGAFD